ncbi:MAG TPA: NAD(P)H-binding protein, partial [Gaiellaceae bacterium]|nr:NAD(P)H-binding protein [Gaiellaceae bacterium]
LRGHEVVGMTRSRPELVRELGAEPVVCDVYDRERLFEAVAAARPEVVVSLLTDLANRDFEANARIRREGFPNLVDAAAAAGARRLVVESVSFELPPDGAAAVAAMEEAARESGLETEILRFDILCGPYTWHEQEEDGPGLLHVREAAERVIAAL